MSPEMKILQRTNKKDSSDNEGFADFVLNKGSHDPIFKSHDEAIIVKR
jgi:hypothetical protein